MLRVKHQYRIFDREGKLLCQYGVSDDSMAIMETLTVAQQIYPGAYVRDCIKDTEAGSKLTRSAYIKNLLFVFILLSTLATLFCLASCTREDVIPTDGTPEPIVLSVSTESAKTIVPGPSLPDSYTIYGSAYYTSVTTPETSGNYFVGKPFNYVDNQWVANPTVYWPLGGSLSFLFIACEDSELDFASNATWNDNCISGIELNLPDGKCSTSEILYATTRNRTAGGGAVTLEFKHAQSWLQFEVSTATEILRIDSVVVKGVYTGGKFRVDNSVYMDAEWNIRGRSRHNVTIPQSKGLIPVPGTPKAFSILVPEQDACDLDIYYSTRPSVDSPWSAAISNVYHHEGGIDPWFYGKKNIFQIGFAFSEITITASVRDWEDKSSDIIVE